MAEDIAGNAKQARPIRKYGKGPDTDNIIAWVKRGWPIAEYTALWAKGGTKAVSDRLKQTGD